MYPYVLLNIVKFTRNIERNGNSENPKINKKFRLFQLVLQSVWPNPSIRWAPKSGYNKIITSWNPIWQTNLFPTGGPKRNSLNNETIGRAISEWNAV